MKLASFRDGALTTWGLVQADGVQLATSSLRAQFPELRDVLAAGAVAGIPALLAPERLRDPSSLHFAPVIPEPARILCVGVNYLAHIHEMGRERPDYPTLFTRFPDSLVGHRESIVRPRLSTHYDYEGELAIVIGRAARYVRAENALDHVAGYTCFLDGSVRDWQRHTTQFLPGKNFPGTGSCGPWLVTTDEISDPDSLVLQTRVNGEILQRAPISDLCFDVRQIIEYCSGFCVLNPGDIIATGTPSGVGFARTPPRWLIPGDVVEVDISGIGVLCNKVIDEENPS
ncbi:MAG: fumarylacetoacetate hydrolase family protein [Gammaproteobacteria bacterium]|nr:fumarylacetoacetate hydrolase family protein [Gammaproteobacteria bacterium]MDH5275030.1 fumarylacetoacetate hydrolase family protein [Gammaproteobacteria bacterium]